MSDTLNTQPHHRSPYRFSLSLMVLRFDYTDPSERLQLDSPIRSPYLCNRKNDALFVVGTDTQIIPLLATWGWVTVLQAVGTSVRVVCRV